VVLAFVAYRLRADIRGRMRTIGGLALLVALIGGIVLASASGARRTASAYDRFLAEANAPELLVSPPGGPGVDPTPFYDAIARLPSVRGIEVFAGLPLVAEGGTPSERLAEAFGGIAVLAPIEQRSESRIARPRMIAGRMPHPDRAEEIAVTERLAAQEGLEVGDRIDGVLMTESDTDVVGLVASAEEGIAVDLTIVGVAVVYDEVVPFSELNNMGTVIATAPLAALVPRGDWNFEGAQVDAAPGTDRAALTAEIEALAEELDVTGGPVFVSDQAEAASDVDEAIQPLAVSLMVAAAAFALVGALTVGQALARAGREGSEEIEALRAVGSRRADRIVFALGRSLLVGVVGAIGAVIIAVTASPLFPISVARTAEPDPGLRVDGPVLAAGAIGIVIVTSGAALLAAAHATRRRLREPAVSPLAGMLGSAGMSLPAAQGIRFAFSGSGRVPVRTTLISVTFAIVAVLATATFSESLAGLLDTPDRYGQGWDRMVDGQFGPAPVTRVIERLRDEPTVRGIGVGSYGDAVVGGVPVPAFELTAVMGEISVSLVEGRPAVAPDEIVLGGEVLDRLGLGVGDRVEVDAGKGPTSMQVTGRGVFPHMGQGSFSTTQLGIGAQMPAGTLASFTDDIEQLPAAYLLDGRTYHFVAVDIDGAPSSLDAAFDEVGASVAEDGGFAFLRTEQPPTKIRDLDRVRVVPGAMAGVLALVAVAALAHVLVTSVRERRRELALLRALGFSQRQLYATVSWHASAVAAVSLAVGAPLGLALGTAVWRSFAGGLHAAAPPESPWLWMVVAVAATLVVANLLAAIPGRRAARTSPAITLRTE
jgi:ABC-type lipoprotein release transport system permease subunit